MPAVADLLHWSLTCVQTRLPSCALLSVELSETRSADLSPLQHQRRHRSVQSTCCSLACGIWEMVSSLLFMWDQGPVLCASAILQASLSPNNNVLTHSPGPDFHDVALCDCQHVTSKRQCRIAQDGLLWTGQMYTCHAKNWKTVICYC